MKTALIIPVYNRPQYLRQCFDSLKAVGFPEETFIILINDASTDPEAIKLFNEFHIDGVEIIRFVNQTNQGIKFNLLKGYGFAFGMGCEIVQNLDSDAVVKPNFFMKAIKGLADFNDFIVTCFHSTTRNSDGSERHRIIASPFKDFVIKESVGGIHMACRYGAYLKYMLPALIEAGNWDHNTCINATADGKGVFCAVPSLIQHIGIQSSMGHSLEQPDVADDFFSLELPDVTLFGLDSVNFNGLKTAAEISQRDIKFGDVVLLDHKHINCKERYSSFIINELHEFIKTSHVLIIQADGYVLNHKAWRNEWLQFDYIGATWIFCDNMNVGNGGFSLRSKKLLKATPFSFPNPHPEDYQICRVHRKRLEKEHGLKWATEEIANNFSIEAYGKTAFPEASRYSGQFGFHGSNVDFKGADLPHIPKIVKAAVHVVPIRPTHRLRGSTFQNKQI